MLIWPIVLFAATRNVSSTGNWTDSGTWTGGNIPIATDDVTMDNSVGVTVQGGETISVVSITTGNTNTITIDATGQLTLNNSGLDALVATNGVTLNVNGTLIINGNLDVNNNLILNVTGTLVVNGNVNLSNGASLDVTSTGDIDINGDFTGGNNTAVNVDGTVSVSGDLDVGNGSTLTGGGTFELEGSCDDDGSTFCESGTLPVSLVSFSVSQSHKSVIARWTTADEENFDYFCLERSDDALEFTCVAEIAGNNKGAILTDYEFEDFNPLEGRSYYRLKAVDLDGSYETFQLKSVFFSNDRYGFSIYPNPTNHGDFEINLDFVPRGDLRLHIRDLRGRVMADLQPSVNEGSVEVRSNLSAGIYLVTLSDERGIKVTQRLRVD